MRLAFRPCRRATAATEMPGASASSTILLRSSRLLVRRRSPAAPVLPSGVHLSFRWTPNLIKCGAHRRPSDHAYREAEKGGAKMPLRFQPRMRLTERENESEKLSSGPREPSAASRQPLEEAKSAARHSRCSAVSQFEISQGKRLRYSSTSPRLIFCRDFLVIARRRARFCAIKVQSSINVKNTITPIVD